jgi:hypothetical protein
VISIAINQSNLRCRVTQRWTICGRAGNLPTGEIEVLLKAVESAQGGCRAGSIRDAYDDAGISERTRVAGHRAAGALMAATVAASRITSNGFG